MASCLYLRCTSCGIIRPIQCPQGKYYSICFFITYNLLGIIILKCFHPKTIYNKTIFNSKFFETEFYTVTEYNVTTWDEHLNETVYINRTHDVLRASKLRLNTTYVYLNIIKCNISLFKKTLFNNVIYLPA